MTTDQTETYLEQARKLGAEHGRNAASWYFDGNTSAETYAKVLRGIEDGDPEVLESFPSGPLSGEWADGMTPALLAQTVGLDAHAEASFNPDGFDALCSAYEEGYYEASSAEIERVARLQVVRICAVEGCDAEIVADGEHGPICANGHDGLEGDAR